MAITTVTSRQLNQEVCKAKKAAKRGPVFITDRGKPAHVLLSIEEYRQISVQRGNILDKLKMPGLSKIEFEPPRAEIHGRDADPI